jgi:hypothetical protein
MTTNRRQFLAALLASAPAAALASPPDYSFGLARKTPSAAGRGEDTATITVKIPTYARVGFRGRRTVSTGFDTVTRAFRVSSAGVLIPSFRAPQIALRPSTALSHLTNDHGVQPARLRDLAAAALIAINNDIHNPQPLRAAAAAPAARRRCPT